MITSKKRSLNELRQTKDCHYVTRTVNNKLASNQIIESYFNSIKNKEINAENYHQFLSFLKERGYHITKK